MAFSMSGVARKDDSRSAMSDEDYRDCTSINASNIPDLGIIYEAFLLSSRKRAEKLAESAAQARLALVEV